MSEMFTVDGVSKKDKQKLIIKQMTKGSSLWGLVKDGFKLFRAVK